MTNPLSNLKFPEIKLPKFELPGIDLTNFDVKKNIETVSKNTERVATAAFNLSKDIAYVTVGSGVLAFQQAQVRRREIAAAVQSRIPSSVSEITAAGAAVSARVTEFAGKASTAAGEALSTLRSRVAPSA